MSKISNQIKKNDFIIWRYEDGSIRVEETNTFLKTYTHRCEGSRREPVAISPSVIASLP